MMTGQKIMWFIVLVCWFSTNLLYAGGVARWTIASPDSIYWKVNGAHNDHIEMSGLKVSTVLRYGVNAAGEWVIDRNMIRRLFVPFLMILMGVCSIISMETGHICAL